MAIKTLLQMGNPIIYQPCDTVTEFATAELQQLVTDLRDTQLAFDGVGIAAPQIGVNLRVMYFGFNGQNPRYPSKSPYPVTLCINPEYQILDDTLLEDGEGCLCLPTLYGVVPRYKKVKLSYQDIDGQSHELVAEDFVARIIQHECDHLDGKIYLMRITDLKKFGYREEILEHWMAP